MFYLAESNQIKSNQSSMRRISLSNKIVTWTQPTKRPFLLEGRASDI